jgi:hypothetical protein
MTSVDLIRLQQSLLENLYTAEWLIKTQPKHLAQLQWALCAKILRQGGKIRWPEQRDDLSLLTSMLLDASTLIAISGGDLSSMHLGNLAGYGDDAVQRKIRSRLPNPRQFNELMLELHTAAWHQFNGHHVEPLEDRLPDLRVVIDNIDLPVYIECKRVTTSTEAGIRKRILKANRQIKAVGQPCYGIVILDVSGAAGPVNLRPEEIPDGVEIISQYVRRALSGERNRAVGKVIVTWDNSGVRGQPPEPVGLFLMRCHRFISHDPVNGVYILPEEIELFQSQILLLRMTFDDSIVDVERLVFSDVMRECQRQLNFSCEELLEAFSHRDKFERVEIAEDAHVILFARRITWGEERAYILACANQQEATLNLLFAYRIPPTLYLSVDLLTPLEMLGVFTRHYGLPVIVGNHMAHFIHRERFSISVRRDTTSLISVYNPDHHSVMQFTLCKIMDDQEQILVNCALVFAIDCTRLLGDLRR